jgi:hypothetical protein
VYLSDLNTQLQHDVQFLNDHCEKEVDAVGLAAAKERDVLEASFRRLTADHLKAVQALHRHVDGLIVELAETRSKVKDLETQAQKSTFKADKLMALLNDGSTELRGNWPRLRQLFKHFENGTKPPASWKTWLQTEAVDESYKVYSPYSGSPPSDDDDNEGSDQEGKSEENPPPAPSPAKSSRRSSSTRTTSRTPSKKTSPSKSGRGSSSKKPVPPANEGLQRRPSSHKGGQMGCRSALLSLERSVHEACKSLPEFVIWQDLRFDVQVVIRAGQVYADALELLGEDRALHDLFPLEDLRVMLASMMYWHMLDDTPWAKFVPNSYFLEAEVLLDTMAKQDRILAKWPDPTYQDYDDKVEQETLQAGRGKVINLDQDSDDEDEVAKPVRQSKAKRVFYSSDSSSDDDTQAAARASSALSPEKRPRRDSRSSTGSSSRVPPVKKRKSRATEAASLRTQSPLARVDFEKLSTTELAIVERPGPGIKSWRIRGVRAQYQPKNKKNDCNGQTPGFPDYAPQKSNTWILAERWDVTEYKALVAKKPWKLMWHKRVKVLYFHWRADLTSAQIRLLDDFLEYVQENTRAFWEALHWPIMKTKAIEDDVEDEADYEESATLYAKRTARHESVGRKVKKLVQKFVNKGLPETIFQEPGVWTYPVHICYWFLKDPSTVKADGKPYTLEEQLAEIDQAEPGRNQWADCTDEERVAHIPEELKAKLVPASERSTNRVSKKFKCDGSQTHLSLEEAFDALTTTDAWHLCCPCSRPCLPSRFWVPSTKRLANFQV